jgi:hypothetical protein
MPVVCQTSYVTDSYVGYLDVSVMMGHLPIYVMAYLYVSVMICGDLCSNGVNLNLNVLSV